MATPTPESTPKDEEINCVEMQTLHMNSLQHNGIDRRALAKLSLTVAKSKRIIVVTGAGISCSAGIPDFRSAGGLYDQVKQLYPQHVSNGTQFFNWHMYNNLETRPAFYSFMGHLKRLTDQASPTPTHEFIKTLDTRGQLLRSYTQHIDGLEEKAGLASDLRSSTSKGNGKKDIRNIQLHGNINMVICRRCSSRYPSTPEHTEMFEKGIGAECDTCMVFIKDRSQRKARPTTVGEVRPAVLLYEEPGSPLVNGILEVQAFDAKRKPDLMIVMGTTLKIGGLKGLVRDFSKVIHSRKDPRTGKVTGTVIFVNLTPPSAEWNGVFDYHVAGASDDWVGKVMDDWRSMRPNDWNIQTTLKENVVKATKSAKPKAKATKPRADENVPPSQYQDMELSSPDKKVYRTPPSTPSKRARETSHYSKQASPSKKRIQSSAKIAASQILFGDSVNIESQSDDPFNDAVGTLTADLSMQALDSPPRRQKVGI